MAWQRGEIIVHREIWRDRPWMAPPVIVVEDLPAEIGAVLDRGDPRRDGRCASFESDPGWRAPAFPHGWEEVPATSAPPPTAYRLLSL